MCLSVVLASRRKASTIASTLLLLAKVMLGSVFLCTCIVEIPSRDSITCQIELPAQCIALARKEHADDTYNRQCCQWTRLKN